MKKTLRPLFRAFILSGGCLVAVFCLASNAAFCESPKGKNWNSFKNSAARLGLAHGPGVELPFKVLWQYPLEPKSNGFVDWGPVAANGAVFTPDGLNHVLAIDAESGKLLWKQQLVSNVFTVTLSEDANILLVTTAITTQPTPTVFALDPKTGDKLWDNTANGQPAVGGMDSAPVIEKNRVYLPYLRYEGWGGVAALEVSTGKLVWNWKLQQYSPYTPITLANGRLFVGFENKILYCLEAGSGKVLWSSNVLPDIPYAAPAVSKSHVILATGNVLFAFDVKTGLVLWQKSIEGGIGYSSPAIYEDTLFLGTKDSRVLALRVPNGEPVWEQKLDDGSIESSPVIETRKKTLYIGTKQNTIFALDLKSGRVKDRLRLSDHPNGIWRNSPILYNGRIYVGSMDKTLYALN